MILALFISLVENLDKYLKEFLEKINITIPPILTIEYEILFFIAILFIILMYGIFVSGIGYFCQELIYEKFLLNNFRKLKNKWIKRRGKETI